MPGPTTEALSTDLREVTGRLDRLSDDVQALRRHSVRITTLLAVLGTVIGALGLYTLNGVISLQRDLGRMDATLAQHTRQFERFEAQLDRLDSLNDRLHGVAGELARIQGQIEAGKAGEPK